MIEAPGYQPERRTVEVGAGALVRGHVVLQATTVAEKPKLEAIPTDSAGTGLPPEPPSQAPAVDPAMSW